jgi:hypothetical protein
LVNFLLKSNCPWSFVTVCILVRGFCIPVLRICTTILYCT